MIPINGGPELLLIARVSESESESVPVPGPKGTSKGNVISGEK